ncbi:hypothetical protein X792_06180 [Dehalococcoides mccartyi CG1]|nr:hypothetical protein X792_06180 [Dehalococcoides mccartyi CG1]
MSGIYLDKNTPALKMETEISGIQKHLCANLLDLIFLKD